MKTYWLLGRDDDPEKMPTCPFAQLMEREKQQHMLETYGTGDIVPHRPVYSPVSFDDLNADAAHTLSPGGTPHDSPSHGGSLVAESARRGSRGSGVRNNNGDGVAGGGGGGGSSSQGLGVTALLASQSLTKPMQAVPPTRSGSCTPPQGETTRQPEVWTVVTSPPRDKNQHVSNTHCHQGNGVEQKAHVQHEPLQQTHNSDHSNSNQHNHGGTTTSPLGTTVNNNDKSRHVYPAPTSDVQEPCSPVKNCGFDSSKGSITGNGSNRSSKIGSGIIKQGQGRNSSDSRRKDSRTEKPKSKTCSLL